MASIPAMPTHLAKQGRWAISIHHIQASTSELSGSEVALVSQEVGTDFLIKRVDAFPFGYLELNRSTGHKTLVEGRDAGWATAFTRNEIDGHILPSDIYELFGRSTARTLLTGHILALRFESLVRMREVEPSANLSAQWDSQFRFLLGVPEQSLTTFTALNYKLLTDWLETSPSQVLAAIEKVSPTTIRNRLHSARTARVIGKPGAGKRSSISKPSEV